MVCDLAVCSFRVILMVFVDLSVTVFAEVTGVTETIPTESTTEVMHTDTTSKSELNGGEYEYRRDMVT